MYADLNHLILSDSIFNLSFRPFLLLFVSRRVLAILMMVQKLVEDFLIVQ